MSEYVSPLRYPGGRSRQAGFMEEVFRLNGLVGGQYAEVYAGGASVAIHLLFADYASKVYINDHDRSVYSFWHAVLNDTENLCRLINDTPVSLEQWRIQKAIQADSEHYSTLQLAFSTFFLNRTNHSGILTGAVLGGKGQGGEWLLDARYNKPALIARIQRIAQLKDRIALSNRAAPEFIAEIAPRLPRASLLYLDPPYYSKERRSYQDKYKREDHVAIARSVGSLQKNWIVSGDDTPEICELYGKFRNFTYKLSYSTNNSDRGSEVIFYSDGLILPAAQDSFETAPALEKTTYEGLMIRVGAGLRGEKEAEIEIGREYVIQPRKPRKTRNRGRHCLVLGFVPISRSDPDYLVAKVRFTDNNRVGKAEFSDLVPA